VFRAPQVKQGKAIGLVPGVRLEGVDPAGRGWEVTWDPGTDDITVANSMGIYAKRWLTQLRRDATTPPLFVWLEAQEVCRTKDEAGQVNTVKMVGDEELRSTVWTVHVTDGHLPFPYGRELTGYEVADLADTLAKAKTAGVAILAGPYAADHRNAAMVQFPGGYIAEIHATQK